MELNLDDIERRANAATPGPWKYDEPYETNYEIAAPGFDPPIAECFSRPKYGLDVDADANADFIANARADIPMLIARIRELEKENHSMRHLIDLMDFHDV